MDVIQSIERLSTDDSEYDDENEDEFLDFFHEVYRSLN